MRSELKLNLELAVQLAQQTVEATREALGEHDDFTIGVSCLLNVLSFLQSELQESPPKWDSISNERK